MEETPNARFKREFADFLNIRRDALGWPGIELARQAGLSNGAVNPILGARGAPASHRSIKQLLEALDVDQEQSAYWHGQRRSLEAPNPAEVTEEARTSPRGSPQVGPGADDEGPGTATSHGEADNQAPPDREGRSSGLKLGSSSVEGRYPPGRLLITIGLVIVLLGVAATAWLTSTREVTGLARCLSGASVAGVWTKSGGKGRPADVRPTSGSWFTYNGRAVGGARKVDSFGGEK